MSAHAQLTHWCVRTRCETELSNVLTLSLCVAQLLHSLHIASHTQRRWICCQSRHLLLLHSHPALLIQQVHPHCYRKSLSHSRTFSAFSYSHCTLTLRQHSHTLTLLQHCATASVFSHYLCTLTLLALHRLDQTLGTHWYDQLPPFSRYSGTHTL